MDFSEGGARHAPTATFGQASLRGCLSAARASVVKNFGCSPAAKWQPLGELAVVDEQSVADERRESRAGCGVDCVVDMLISVANKN